MQVLVLEDSDMMRGILVKHLLAIGLEAEQIHEAQSGEEALGKLDAGSFDLLLLDIVMEGIDGITVLKEAKKVQPDARIVMCSSFCESGTVKELIDLGINDFIVKPFSEEKLKEALQRNIAAVAG
jgi:two-component system, chemotaxis family, chemotaxis protein CheY